MAKRKIIKIDEEACNGCGACIPNCPEGAIQVIDGKARLISDLFCDGLGACIGYCPKGAIVVEEREAEPYDEKKVMENIIKGGPNVIKAHLEHLKYHNEEELLKQVRKVLTEKGISIPEIGGVGSFSGCPGSKVIDFTGSENPEGPGDGQRQTELRQWPVQLHLVPPTAPYFQGKDVVLAADCVAYALADFHKDYLKGKTLAIACPKLDANQEAYIEKITALVDAARINTLTVMIMEMPCCMGLLQVAKEGASKASRKMPIKCIVVGIKGNIVKNDWV